MDTPITKRCRVCGEDKPLAEMKRKKANKDGYDTRCLACNRLKTKQWAAANPEKVIANRKKFYEQNPNYDSEYYRAYAEKKRVAVRQWRLNNPEKAREKDRNWRLNNAEKERARKQRWFEENREKKRELDRQWREANRDQARASRQKSEQTNLDAGRIRKHRRRAKKKGNGGTFTVQEWQALKARYDHRCLACHRQEPEIQLHQDHVIPIDKGGLNSIDNIQPLCRECNSRKGTKIIDYRKLETEIGKP
jgi:5-methylcytosine-specific restriction endonuclease McrA